MNELIGAVQSTAELAQQARDWAPSFKRFEAFFIIVGGGSLVVLAVVFFHSQWWKEIQDAVVMPILWWLTTAVCTAMSGVLVWCARQAHRRQ